jgi:hypothetical protein
MMATRQSHIVMEAQGEPFVRFAMVPRTQEMACNVLEHHTSLIAFAQATPKLVNAGFWNGAPVFFDAPGFLPRAERQSDPQSLDALLGEVLAEGYAVTPDRPPIPWHWFRGVDCSIVMIEREAVRWQARRGERVITTGLVPITVIAARINPHLKANSRPFAMLADGTPLYPAYHPLRPGERYRRSVCAGKTGEWVGTTLDGRLFRQRQLCDDPDPEKWEKFRLG